MFYVSIMTTRNTDSLQTIDLGNNECISRGVVEQADGSWLALTLTKSREFKTERGARNWYQRQTGRSA